MCVIPWITYSGRGVYLTATYSVSWRHMTTNVYSQKWIVCSPVYKFLYKIVQFQFRLPSIIIQHKTYQDLGWLTLIYNALLFNPGANCSWALKAHIILSSLIAVILHVCTHVKYMQHVFMLLSNGRSDKQKKPYICSLCFSWMNCE